MSMGFSGPKWKFLKGPQKIRARGFLQKLPLRGIWQGEALTEEERIERERLMVRSEKRGLSHGLKTVHRTVFTAAKLPPPFRVPLSAGFHEKAGTLSGCLFFHGVDNGTRTHDLQSHNLTP